MRIQSMIAHVEQYSVCLTHIDFISGKCRLRRCDGYHTH